MIIMNEAKQCPDRSLRSVTPAPQHKPRVSVLVRPSIFPSPFSFLTIDDVVGVIAVLEVAESYYFTRAVGVPLRAAAQPRSSVRPSVRPVNAISVNMAVYPHCSHPAAQRSAQTEVPALPDFQRGFANVMGIPRLRRRES